LSTTKAADEEQAHTSPLDMSSPTDSFFSTKRPRIHKTKSGGEIETYESPDLWFEDGNIIIRAVLSDDRAAHIAYKVHKSILITHSNVFRDLFDGPQGAFDVASDRYDGLPVIQLPDPPSEVNNFLKALYFPE